MITDLGKHKDVKKAEKVEKDLSKMLKNIQISIDTIKEHKQYVSIMECLSILSTSYKVVEIQLRKCKEFIKDQKNEEN